MYLQKMVNYQNKNHVRDPIFFTIYWFQVICDVESLLDYSIIIYYFNLCINYMLLELLRKTLAKIFRSLYRLYLYNLCIETISFSP